MPKIRSILITACAATALVPGSANAAVSCDFDAAQKRLDVTLTAAGNHAPIQRDGSDIRVGGKLCPDGDTVAHVYNTDRITVEDTSDGATDVAIITWTGAFAPGATAEGDGSSEIEFEVDGGSGFDSLSLIGGPANDTWRLGEVPGGGGVNLNAGTEASKDVDVTTSLINEFDIHPGDGDDNVSAAGGAPFAAPLDLPVELDGGDHDDFLIGGEQSDVVDGGTGTDTVLGAGGHDELTGGGGKDSIFGGSGNDIAEYEYAGSGVTVDLAAPDYQETGGAGLDFLSGVEAIGGSKHPDKLYGTSGANTLHGREGADNLAGRGGDDSLLGGPAKDVARYAGAPKGVTVDLDLAGFQDTRNAGLDQLIDIESLAGTQFSDDLRGDEGSNTLNGGGGKDYLSGRGGDDTLQARDGEADTARCGAGIDSVQTDTPGLDAIDACETVDAL